LVEHSAAGAQQRAPVVGALRKQRREVGERALDRRRRRLADRIAGGAHGVHGAAGSSPAPPAPVAPPRRMQQRAAALECAVENWPDELVDGLLSKSTTRSERPSCGSCACTRISSTLMTRSDSSTAPASPSESSARRATPR
jgi:hypothetical protein